MKKPENHGRGLSADLEQVKTKGREFLRLLSMVKVELGSEPASLQGTQIVCLVLCCSDRADEFLGLFADSFVDLSRELYGMARGIGRIGNRKLQAPSVFEWIYRLSVVFSEQPDVRQLLPEGSAEVPRDVSEKRLARGRQVLADVLYDPYKKDWNTGHDARQDWERCLDACIGGVDFRQMENGLEDEVVVARRRARYYRRECGEWQQFTNGNALQRAVDACEGET